MATRRPLVVEAGSLKELPVADTLAFSLPDADSSTPESLAVKQGGVWKQISWAAFLILVGSVTPTEPTGSSVNINGSGVTINGEQVVINAASNEAQMTIGGEVVTINGEIVEVT